MYSILHEQLEQFKDPPQQEDRSVHSDGQVGRFPPVHGLENLPQDTDECHEKQQDVR
jgi:hypothetical protein